MEWFDSNNISVVCFKIKMAILVFQASKAKGSWLWDYTYLRCVYTYNLPQLNKDDDQHNEKKKFAVTSIWTSGEWKYLYRRDRYLQVATATISAD